MASCAADVSRAIIAVLAAACGSVKVFVRSITWTVPRRQSIKEGEALLQDLRPVASPKMWLLSSGEAQRLQSSWVDD